MSSQKKRRVREKDKERKFKKRHTNTDHQSSENQVKGSSGSALENSATPQSIKQKAYRMRKQLPKSPKKFASVLGHLVRNATPRKATALKDIGLSDNMASCKKKLEVFTSSLKQSLVRLKNKRQHKWNVAKRIFAYNLKNVRKAKVYKMMSTELGIDYKFLRKYASMEVEEDEDMNKLMSRKKRKDSLKPETLDRVSQFFTSSATHVPDKKAVDKRTLESKMVLGETVTKVYQNFKKEYPESQVSLSQFHKLRPRNVKPNRQQKLYQSRCEYCTNSKLKLEAINRLCDRQKLKGCKIPDNHILIDLTLCEKDPQTENHKQYTCVTRECDLCGSGNIKRHLQPLIDRTNEEHVTWTYWTSVPYTSGHGENSKQSTRKTLESKTEPVTQLIDELMVDAHSLAKHLFVAEWQKECFNTLSKTIPQESIVMHLDFSENYSTFFQNEVSSAHWVKNLVTVHPLVVFYNCPSCDGVTHPVMDVLIFLSNDTKHDHHAVHEFMSRAVRFLKEERDVQFSKIYEFTDGCASQFKSRGPFADISFCEEDWGVKRERYYFGSCHGKGPSDAAGGVTKTAARMAVIRGEAIITDARSMYAYLHGKLRRGKTIENICNHSRREFFLVDKINRNRPEREICTTVKGTRNFHGVRGLSPGVICVRDLACTCMSCLRGDIDCMQSTHVDPWAIKRLNLKIPQTAKGIGRQSARGRSKCESINHVEPYMILRPSLPKETGAGRKRGIKIPQKKAISGTVNAKKRKTKQQQKEASVPEKAKKERHTVGQQKGVSANITVKAKEKGKKGPKETKENINGIGATDVGNERHAYFEAKMREIRSLDTYEELETCAYQFTEECENIYGHVSLDLNVSIVESKFTGDSVAQELLPDDLPDELTTLIPVNVLGDGNCLARSASVLAFGDERHHVEIRYRIILELLTHSELYLNLDYVNRGASLPPNEEKCLTTTYAMFSEYYITGNALGPALMKTLLESEIMGIRQKDSYMGIWELFAISSVMGCKLLSVYPNLGPPVSHLTLHRLILPRELRHANSICGIMWTSMRTQVEKNWVPNHFVPFLPVTSPQHAPILLAQIGCDDFADDLDSLEDSSFINNLIQTLLSDSDDNDESLSKPNDGHLPEPASVFAPDDGHLPEPASVSAQDDDHLPEPASLSALNDCHLPEPAFLSAPYDGHLPEPATDDDHLQEPAPVTALDDGHLPEPVSVSAPDDGHLTEPASLSAPDDGHLPEPVSVSAPDDGHLPEYSSLSAPDDGHLPEPASLSALNDDLLSEPAFLSALNDGHLPEPASVSAPDDGYLEPVSVSAPDDGHHPEPASVSTPDDGHLPEPSSLSAPDDGHLPEPASLSAPDDGHLSEPASVSAPDDGHLSEPASVSAPDDGHLSEPASVSAPDDGHLEPVPAPDDGHLSEPVSVSAPDDGHLSEPAFLYALDDSHLPEPASLSALDDGHLTEPASVSAPDDGHLPEPASLSAPDDGHLSEPASVSAPDDGHLEPVSVSAPDDGNLSEPVSVSATDDGHLSEPASLYALNDGHLPEPASLSAPDDGHLSEPASLYAPDDGHLPEPASVSTLNDDLLSESAPLSTPDGDHLLEPASLSALDGLVVSSSP